MEAIILYREPPIVPHLPGIFALVNRKRRYAYISFTSNLQKRSHSLSHMLLRYDEDPSTYWPIRDLPKNPSEEHVFMVMLSRNITPANALAGVASVQRQFEAKGYRLVEGNRASSPTVTVNGKRMTLADAVRLHSTAKYLTVYRRVERGWTPEEALGLVPPAPRWHQGMQQERKGRAQARKAA